MRPTRESLQTMARSRARAMNRQLHQLIEEYDDSESDECSWLPRSFPTGGRKVNQLGLGVEEYAAGSGSSTIDHLEASHVLPDAVGLTKPEVDKISSTSRTKQKVAADPNTVRTFWKRGVWHVTNDNAFFGHYLEARPALHAAIDLALDIELEGGSALIVFGPPPALAPLNESVGH